MPGFDPLHLAIALGPLAVYFLVLGVVNLSRRPHVTTGARDRGALGIAISGLVVAGPMELFFPEGAAALWGWFVWILLLSFYFLGLLLICLLARPRLVIYNVSPEELREILSAALPTIDKDARFDVDSLLLPNLGVQGHIEPFSSLRNVQIVASGPRQNHHGWSHFASHLSMAFRQAQVPPNPYGVTLLMFALLMLGSVAYFVLHDQQAVAQAFHDMLRW
jgi:hypothetical protein